MPNKKSAFKRLRQDTKKHETNKAAISEIRTFTKKARTNIAEGNKETSETSIRALESKLGKAVKTNKMKPNQASRTISRLRSQASKIGAK